MSLLASDVSRLVHHYLLQKGFENTANLLISECVDLKGLKPVKAPFRLPRLLGPSLLDLLNGYFDTKDCILEELESFESAEYNEQDSLPTLTKTLVHSLKQPTSNASLSVNCEKRDASTNTDFTSDDVKLKLDASVSTDLTYSTKSTCDVGVNTEACTGTFNSQVPGTSGQTAYVDDDSSSLCSSYPPSVEQGEEISFFTSLVVDRLIENREIQEKIAERINKRSTEVLTPKKNVPNLEEDTLSHDISSVIKAIAEETTADPAFNTFLKHCLGLDSSQCPTPVGTPKSASAQEGDQPSPAAPAPELEPPVQDSAKDSPVTCENYEPPVQDIVQDKPSTAQNYQELPVQNFTQDRPSTAENYQPPPETSHDALATSLALCPAPNNDFAQLQANQFSGYVCVADASGQLTLVPSLVTSMPPVLALPPPQGMQYPEENMQQTVTILNIVQEEQAPQEAPKKRANKRTRKPPPQKKLANLAPKPAPEPIPIIITIPDLNEYQDQQLGEAVEQIQKPTEVTNTVEAVLPTKTKAKPLVRATNHLKSSKNKRLATNQTSSSLQPAQPVQPSSSPGPGPAVPSSPPVASSLIPPVVSVPSPVQPTEQPKNPAIPTALEALLRIAKKEAESISPKLPTPLQTSTGIRPDAEVATTTPAAEPVSYITTPTSSSRRRNHVRQLNFGESPDLPIASSQPIPLHVQSQNVANSSPVRPARSQIPWDLALRKDLASPAKDQNIFATPKGKAKRTKKTSPVAQTPPKGDSSKEKSAVKRTLETQEPQEEKQLKADEEQEKPDEEINLLANETFEDSMPGITISQPELSPPSSSITMKSCSRGADSNEAAAASGLIEMANSNPAPPSQEEQLQASFSDLPTQFSHMLPAPSSQTKSVPVHATPQKDQVVCEGSSSMSFGAWDGEIPRTPQIRLDVTNSNSPFQVSLTKGFRFLPAAESPSLSVPLTPSIAGTNSNSSIETPYVGFNQFASILNTPRVEALRQEFGDSPSRSLSTTMISPTQVVLGRSAPYFVPSGERAQGPPNNNIATPEHVPESEKKTRRRRSSTDMEPLQLEESNDASDAATALMSEAAANVAAALEKPSVSQPPTPSKSDQTLESDLINECRRLENAPPSERGMTRREMFVSLFGEDSESGPPSNQPEEKAAKASKPTRKQPARARKTSAEKEKEAASKPTGRSAKKKATVSNTPVKSDRKRGRSVNCSSEDAAGGSRTPEVVAEKDDETIIKELLSLARIRGIGTASSPAKKRKRSSSPRRSSRESDVESQTPPSKRLPPSSGSKCPLSDIKSPDVTREIASTSIETSFSQEESDRPGEETPKKKPAKKSDKGKKKQLAKAICSPIARIIDNTLFRTPAAATPVRLFKPANSFGRLSRQGRSMPVRRRPVVSDVPAGGRELELSTVPEEPTPNASPVAENNNQADYARKEPEQLAPSAEPSTSEIPAQQISSQVERDVPNVNIANNRDVMSIANSEPTLQSSLSDESTLVQDAQAAVRPVTSSSFDLSATKQPVNPPVDHPGPSNEKKRSPKPSSAEKKQTKSKKRQPDPKLQNYLLLHSISTKPPKTRRPDPIPFEIVQNHLVTPQSSSGARPSSSAKSSAYQTQLWNKVTKKLLRKTDAQDLYSQ